MKRFRFTLQPLLGVRSVEERQIQAEMMAIMARMNELRAHRAELEAAIDAQAERRRQIGARGAAALHFRQIEAYLGYLREEIERIDEAIEACERERLECQGRLMEKQKEIKALEKLKDAQLERYKKEAQLEEDKEMDDFIGFSLN